MQPDPHATEIFLHIRVVMGIMLGMSMTRLLTGAARFVQHPGKQKIYWVHLGWVVSMLLTLIHFWWWEFRLYDIQNWNFQIYFFLIVYTIVLFLLCTLLFPDNIAEYSGYEDFFISRRSMRRYSVTPRSIVPSASCVRSAISPCVTHAKMSAPCVCAARNSPCSSRNGTS